MAGSKAVVTFYLLYDALNDAAYWALNSDCTKLELAQPQRWSVIEVGQENYEVISKMAGPKPEVLVEEVTQHTRKDNEETADDGYTVYSDNLAKRK